jgi:hypothetical protein
MPIGLYHLLLATTEQLTRLHYKPGMHKTVLRRLKVLADNGYIQANSIPTKPFKSPYYYTLDSKGVRYLESIGLDTDPSFRVSKEVSGSYLHLRHALELNDVFVAALKLKYQHPDYYLSRFIHERVLKRNPYKAQGVTFIPDGLVDIRQRSTGLCLSLILEHDRGTEQQEHFRRRIRAYSAFLNSGAYKQLLGTERVTIAFTTFVSMKRVMLMRAWTDAELQADAQLHNMFVFAELPRPLEAHHLLFDNRWLTLNSDQPIALLGG